MQLTQTQRRRHIKICAYQQAKSVKRGSQCSAKNGSHRSEYSATLTSLFKLKLYSIIVTALLVTLLGSQTLLFYMEKGNEPIHIATFADSNGQPGQFKLNYNTNGGLTFTSDRSQSPIPSITHWDYYGATEIKGYSWISDSTIVIETMDSTIKIIVPEFTILPK